MARIKYYYDTEKCEYQKARLTWKSALKSLSTYSIVAAIGAAGFFAWRMFFHDTTKESWLKQQIRDYETHVGEFDDRMASLSKSLDGLEEKDKNLYRLILEMEPGTSTGGTGGTEKAPTFQVESLQESEAKLDQIQTKLKLQESSYISLFETLKEKEVELHHIPSILPTTGQLISGFGLREHPILGIKKLHTGLDFTCKIGTPVYASGDGIVMFCGRSSNGYGIHIDINHGFGYITKYAHLSEIKVATGQRVKRGDVIGLSGNTGLSKGPHLHYEITKSGNKINPVDYFYSDLAPDEYVKFKKRAAVMNESMD